MKSADALESKLHTLMSPHLLNTSTTSATLASSGIPVMYTLVLFCSQMIKKTPGSD